MLFASTGCRYLCMVHKRYAGRVDTLDECNFRNTPDIALRWFSLFGYRPCLLHAQTFVGKMTGFTVSPRQIFVFCSFCYFFFNLLIGVLYFSLKCLFEVNRRSELVIYCMLNTLKGQRLLIE